MSRLLPRTHVEPSDRGGELGDSGPGVGHERGVQALPTGAHNLSDSTANPSDTTAQNQEDEEDEKDEVGEDEEGHDEKGRESTRNTQHRERAPVASVRVCLSAVRVLTMGTG